MSGLPNVSANRLGVTLKGRSNLTIDDELQSKLREAYETIAKMERKNHFLVDVIESLKNTYEFFELTNDQKILEEKPYAML
jgi:thymidylate kinase